MLDANYGVVGVVLAHIAIDGETVLTESSARATDSCRDNLKWNGGRNPLGVRSIDTENGLTLVHPHSFSHFSINRCVD